MEFYVPGLWRQTRPETVEEEKGENTAERPERTYKVKSFSVEAGTQHNFCK